MQHVSCMGPPRNGFGLHWTTHYQWSRAAHFFLQTISLQKYLQKPKIYWNSYRNFIIYLFIVCFQMLVTFLDKMFANSLYFSYGQIFVQCFPSHQNRVRRWAIHLKTSQKRHKNVTNIWKHCIHRICNIWHDQKDDIDAPGKFFYVFLDFVGQR